MASPRSPQVLVVGAGAAGLSAAAWLARRGVPVVVLEARDRPGGRVDTVRDPVLGVALELGAEFVHGRPARTLALARRAGARVREVPDRHALREGGRLAEAADAFARAEELLALGAGDAQPFAAVLAAAARRRVPAAVRRLAADFVRGFYLADPRTASAGALARFTRGLAEVGGEVTGRLEGGYARVLEPLLADLRRAGGELRCATRVEELRWSPGRVEVRARGPGGGPLRLRGARALLTLPVGPLRAGDVRFRPDLPAKRRAARRLTMGPVVKALLRFRRAPWGDRGAGAPAFLHVPGAPFPVLWSLAPLAAPVLVGWAGGPDAARLAGAGEAAVVRAALASAARALRRPAAALEEALDGARVVDWSRDPLAGGGYAVFPTGSAGAAEELARPEAATLFFAGEATAGGLAGTVEGALRSGERAAAEVLAALRRPQDRSSGRAR